MEWSKYRSDPSRSHPGSLDFIPASSPETSRVPSPYPRPTGRMEHVGPGVRLQRNFSDDHFSSGDDRHSPLRRPPAKRRPPPVPVPVGNQKSTTAVRAGGAAGSRKEISDADNGDMHMADSKYAASGVSSPRRKTAEASLLKTLLVPSTSKATPVATTPRTPLRKIQRAAWKTPAGQKNFPIPAKIVVARGSGAVSTLTEVREKSKEWWKLEDSGSTCESEGDEVSQIVEKFGGKELRGSAGGAVVRSNARAKKPAAGLVLPELTTQDEKDLLSDIFQELRNGMGDGEDDSDDLETVPTVVSARHGGKAIAPPRERLSSESDYDSSCESSDATEDIKVHINLGTLPIYNAATFSNSPANCVSNLTCSRPSKTAFPRQQGKGKKGKFESDALDLVSLESIMKTLPENLANWKISRQDQMRGHGSYLQQREDRLRLNVCHRCGADVNSAKHYCQPGVACALCHGIGHWRDKCPFKDTVITLNCSRCGQAGHVDAICPEQWRQYHSTTSHSGPINRAPKTAAVKHACCYNCGNASHYGHECKRRAYDRTPLPFPNPLLKSYDPPRQFAQYTSGMMDQHPLDEFHEFVTNNLTDDSSSLMMGNGAGKRGARATFAGTASPRGRRAPSGSPKKKKKKKQSRNGI